MAPFRSNPTSNMYPPSSGRHAMRCLYVIGRDGWVWDMPITQWLEMDSSHGVGVRSQSVVCPLAGVYSRRRLSENYCRCCCCCSSYCCAGVCCSCCCLLLLFVAAVVCLLDLALLHVDRLIVVVLAVGAVCWLVLLLLLLLLCLLLLVLVLLLLLLLFLT